MFDLLSSGLRFGPTQDFPYHWGEGDGLFNVPLSIHCTSLLLFGHFPRTRVLLTKKMPWGHRLGYRAVFSPSLGWLEASEFIITLQMAVV